MLSRRHSIGQPPEGNATDGAVNGPSSEPHSDGGGIPEGVLEALRQYVNASTWQFAKSMPRTPHWYVKKEWSDHAGFELLATAIKDYGTRRPFFRSMVTYLDLDGFQYWGWSVPVKDAILINRAKIRGTGEGSRDHGARP